MSSRNDIELKCRELEVIELSYCLSNESEMQSLEH